MNVASFLDLINKADFLKLKTNNKNALNNWIKLKKSS